MDKEMEENMAFRYLEIQKRCKQEYPIKTDVGWILSLQIYQYCLDIDKYLFEVWLKMKIADLQSHTIFWHL